MNQADSENGRPIANPLRDGHKPDRKAQGVLLGIVALAVAAIAGMVIASGIGGDDPGDDGPSHAEEVEAMIRMDDAYDFCTDAVRDRLRSPATAEFSDRDEHWDGDLYRFTGVVDSQNGHGALLRSDFACEIRWTGSAFTAVTVAVV